MDIQNLVESLNILNRIAHYLKSSSILADQREYQPTLAKLAHHLLMMPNFDLYNLERGLQQLMVSLKLGRLA
jgi:hypothetical protein